MVVLISFFILLVSCLFFLSQDHNFNIFYQVSASASNYLNDIKPDAVKVVNPVIVVDSVNAAKESVYLDTNISRTKKALQKNLTHLQFIITIEESLVNLATNDRCNAMRKDMEKHS